MSSIGNLLNAFVRVDDSVPAEILNVEKTDFAFVISISNSLVTSTTEKNLEAYFGGLPVKTERVPDSHTVKIRVSRVRMPDSGYPLNKVIRFVEEKKSQGWFLGIGSHGPQFFNPDDLTHAVVFGASGYGKSNFFRFLLAQTLAFDENTVNFIVDPKQVDFRAFANHPRVAEIADSDMKWKALFGMLFVEMAYREHLFSRSFAIPPVNWAEYRKFRTDFKRNDLPDLPRILFWVDEAHMIFDDMDREHLSTLVRKARAFGIHFVFSTQRYNDVPHSIRAQANTVFSFYTVDGNDVLTEQFRQPHSIRGRLAYFNPTKREFNNCQTPMLTSEDALGMAFGYSPQSRFPKQGLSRLSLSADLISPLKLSSYIAKGTSLSDLERPDWKPSKERMYDSVDRPNPYAHWHDAIGETAAPVAPKKKESEAPAAKKTEPDLDTSQLTRDLLALFEESKPSTSENKSSAPSGRPRLSESKEPSKPSPDTSPAPKLIKLQAHEVTKNLLAVDKLIAQFVKIRDESHLNFNWVLKDLSSNSGLISVFKKARFEFLEESNLVAYDDLALDEITQSRLERFKIEAEAALAADRKPPLLIIYGPPGMGKRTVLEAIAKKLSVDLRAGKPQDLALAKDYKSEFSLELGLSESENDNPESKPKKKKTKEAAEKIKKEFLYFNQDESALTYYRHTGTNNLVALVTEPVQNFMGGSVERDFKFLNEPFVQLSLSAKTYATPEVGDKLVSTILKKHKFRGTKDQRPRATMFVNAGIKIIPSHIDPVVARAQKIATYKSIPFNLDVLKDIIESVRFESTGAATQVEVIHPTRTLEDLIVAPETLKDLQDVMFKAKNIDAQNFQFMAKLRKKGRMIALFSGPPGTGKSLAAEVVAKETGKELWVASIDKLQSAYVGETEKIMSDVFASASAAKAILLIDEADAFLGSREGMGQGYERRWANHLLNLTENYSGILIFTTNYPNVADGAFSRRIDVKAAFKEPTQEMMIKILERLFYPDAPLDKNFDFKKATAGVTLSGGLLRNAVERAVLKMERTGAKKLTTEAVREALIETQDENELINRTEKQLGF